MLMTCCSSHRHAVIYIECCGSLRTVFCKPTVYNTVTFNTAVLIPVYRASLVSPLSLSAMFVY